MLYWVGRVLEADGRLLRVAEGQLMQMAPWERYIRAFDRALLVALGDASHGETSIEIMVSLAGLLGGTGLMAYLTSTVVDMVRGMNATEENARQKISQARRLITASSGSIRQHQA